jgi:hypothetical protein
MKPIRSLDLNQREGMVRLKEFAAKPWQKPGGARNPKQEMERAKGFEPLLENSESIDSKYLPQHGKPDYTQIHAHAAGASCPDLSKVVAAWPKLPAPLKAAVLALVNSMEGAQ